MNVLYTRLIVCTYDYLMNSIHDYEVNTPDYDRWWVCVLLVNSMIVDYEITWYFLLLIDVMIDEY